MLLKLNGTQAVRVGIEHGACEVVAYHHDVDAEPGVGLIVLKEPGEHYWASRGTTKYAGACYEVYRVNAIRDDGLLDITRMYLEWPVRPKPSDHESLLTKLRAYLTPAPAPVS